MRVLAVIPARGGSKGLPGKNIRPLAGMPLVAHAIAFARASGACARTIVSTDSEEIVAVARAWGGEAPFLRPAELATDAAPMMPVLTHALDACEREDGSRYDAVLLLEPTCPVRSPDAVARAVALLDGDPTTNSVVACSEPQWNPFFVGVTESGGVLSRAFPDMKHVERRQDAPRFLRINGSLYLFRAAFLRAHEGAWLDHGPHRVLETPETSAFDVDTLEDFEALERAVERGVVALPWLSRVR